MAVGPSGRRLAGVTSDGVCRGGVCATGSASCPCQFAGNVDEPEGSGPETPSEGLSLP